MAPAGAAPSMVTDTLGSPELISDALRELRTRHLLIPIEDADPELWKDSYYQSRGERTHQAVDIMAPRDTPIHAVEDGTIERMAWNTKGGNTIYQRDPSGRFIYYYAHLQRYEDGIKNGDFVRRGQVIGYVGTTGNAPPNAPHLHLSIEVATNPNRLSGVPINPYEVFSSVPFAPDRKLYLRSLASSRRFTTASAGSGNPGSASVLASSTNSSLQGGLARSGAPFAVAPQATPATRKSSYSGVAQSQRPGGLDQRNPVVVDNFGERSDKARSAGLASTKRGLRNWFQRKTKKWLGSGMPINSLLK